MQRQTGMLQTGALKGFWSDSSILLALRGRKRRQVKRERLLADTLTMTSQWQKKML